MTSQWTVRAVRAEDARIIANHRAYRNEPWEDIDAYAASLPIRIERGTYIGFVAEVAGRVVGGAGAVLLDWRPTRGVMLCMPIDFCTPYPAVNCNRESH